MYNPDTEAVCRCLAKERRRTVIAYFRDRGIESASLDDIVDYVASREAPPPRREKIVISLYHIHLPILADCDIVEIDTETDTVRYHSRPEVERVLETGRDP